jgi:hypothetical protein
LQLGVQRDASNGGTPNVPQKKLLMGQSIWLIQKEKEKVVSAPMI